MNRRSKVSSQRRSPWTADRGDLESRHGIDGARVQRGTAGDEQACAVGGDDPLIAETGRAEIGQRPHQGPGRGVEYRQFPGRARRRRAAHEQMRWARRVLRFRRGGRRCWCAEGPGRVGHRARRGQDGDRLPVSRSTALDVLSVEDEHPRPDRVGDDAIVRRERDLAPGERVEHARIRRPTARSGRCRHDSSAVFTYTAAADELADRRRSSGGIHGGASPSFCPKWPWVPTSWPKTNSRSCACAGAARSASVASSCGRWHRQICGSKRGRMESSCGGWNGAFAAVASAMPRRDSRLAGISAGRARLPGWRPWSFHHIMWLGSHSARNLARAWAV